MSPFLAGDNPTDGPGMDAVQRGQLAVGDPAFGVALTDRNDRLRCQDGSPVPFSPSEAFGVVPRPTGIPSGSAPLRFLIGHIGGLRSPEEVPPARQKDAGYLIEPGPVVPDASRRIANVTRFDSGRERATDSLQGNTVREVIPPAQADAPISARGDRSCPQPARAELGAVNGRGAVPVDAPPEAPQGLLAVERDPAFWRAKDVAGTANRGSVTEDSGAALRTGTLYEHRGDLLSIPGVAPGDGDNIARASCVNYTSHRDDWGAPAERYAAPLQREVKAR